MEAFEKIMMSYKCPKALNELQPCESNWYCDGCQQMVYDFRGMTETEILDTFKQSGKKLCGIYDSNRLKVLPQKRNWQKWASAAMVALGLGVNEKAAFAQHGSQMIGKVASPAQKDTSEKTYMLGEIAIIQTAYFPDGYQALQKYLYNYINYKGKFKGISKVIFDVEADGSLKNIRIIAPTETALDNKIKQALRDSKKWIPLWKNGKPVKSEYKLIIDFLQQATNTALSQY